ncbi:WecB/TagA/CpsF family glycosyltransferase [Candidatus Gracilibacteria bacterium]|nr:WecB/TagA/CpsF family glycosyltransferase [Candidatus Gracilibacteria bacterium]
MTKIISILHIPIHPLSRKELETEIRNMLSGNSFSQIATVNPEFLVEAQKNKKFQSLLQSTVNICDGSGISILGRLLLGKSIPRIPGVEVAEMICRICAEEKKSVFFLGGFGVAEKASQAMQKKYPQLHIAGTLDGDMNTLTEVQQARPDVILVAFGAPRQELWLAEKGTQIPSLRLGVGIGGTFDFWAGKVRRAPAFLRALGLEWFWRLLCEPRKRIKRIWRAVCVFPWMMIRRVKKSKSRKA